MSNPEGKATTLFLTPLLDMSNLEGKAQIIVALIVIHSQDSL